MKIKMFDQGLIDFIGCFIILVIITCATSIVFCFTFMACKFLLEKSGVL